MMSRRSSNRHGGIHGISIVMAMAGVAAAAVAAASFTARPQSISLTSGTSRWVLSMEPCRSRSKHAPAIRLLASWKHASRP